MVERLIESVATFYLDNLRDFHNSKQLLTFLCFIESITTHAKQRLIILMNLVKEEIPNQSEQAICASIRRTLSEHAASFQGINVLSNISTKLWNDVLANKEDNRKIYILLAFANPFKETYPVEETLNLVINSLLSGFIVTKNTNDQ